MTHNLEDLTPLDPTLKEDRQRLHEQRLEALRPPIRVYNNPECPEPIPMEALLRAQKARDDIQAELAAVLQTLLLAVLCAWASQVQVSEAPIPTLLLGRVVGMMGDWWLWE